MRAEMNERVDLRDVAQPEIERDVAVARRRRGIVILRLAIMRLSAFRLQPDDEIAEARGAKFENAADAKRIILRRAPSGDYANREMAVGAVRTPAGKLDRPLNRRRLG